jgi:hypothetical protein
MVGPFGRLSPSWTLANVAQDLPLADATCCTRGRAARYKLRPPTVGPRTQWQNQLMQQLGDSSNPDRPYSVETRSGGTSGALNIEIAVRDVPPLVERALSSTDRFKVLETRSDGALILGRLTAISYPCRISLSFTSTGRKSTKIDALRTTPTSGLRPRWLFGSVFDKYAGTKDVVRIFDAISQDAAVRRA